MSLSLVNGLQIHAHRRGPICRHPGLSQPQDLTSGLVWKESGHRRVEALGGRGQNVETADGIYRHLIRLPQMVGDRGRCVDDERGELGRDEVRDATVRKASPLGLGERRRKAPGKIRETSHGEPSYIKPPTNPQPVL